MPGPLSHGLDSLLAAGAPAKASALGLVEMQVVGVRRVIVRRKDRGKQVAGAVAHFPQEPGGIGFPVPVAKDGYLAAIGKAKRMDVDGICRRMLAERALGPSIEPPAAEAPGMVDPHDLRSKMAPRSRQHHVPFPEEERGCYRAGRDEARRGIGERPRTVGAEDDPVLKAAPGIGSRRLLEGSVRQTRRPEQSAAAVRLLAEAGEFCPGEGPDGVGETEPCPEEPLGVFAHHGLERAPAENGEDGKAREEEEPAGALPVGPRHERRSREARRSPGSRALPGCGHGLCR